MTKSKLSISLPPEVMELAKTAAARENMSVSAWLAQAAEQKAVAETWREEALQSARELVAEAEALHGPPSEEDLRWLDGAMAVIRNDDSVRYHESSNNDLPMAA